MESLVGRDSDISAIHGYSFEETAYNRSLQSARSVPSRLKLSVMNESGNIMIRNATSSDAHAIAAIYNHYIKNTIITFEEKEVIPAEIADRFENVASESLPWLVAEDKGEIIGYAYATKWKTRSAYRFSVESTVYLDKASMGKGIGSMLYSELLSLLKNLGIHAVMGGIALPNPSSVALHEKFGFKKVAQFNEVGTKFGKWIDVGYWQVLLNS